MGFGPDVVAEDVQQHLDAIIAQLAPGEVGESMADELLASIPEFGRATDADFRAGLVLSCTGNVTTLWTRLLDRVPAEEPVVPPAGATAWSRELVHRGLPLPALLRAYRLGHGYAEERMAEAAEELDVPGEVRWRVLSHASRVIFTYIDAICTQLVEDYENEHARWIRGAAAARAELISAILDGQPVEPEAATERLRYDVSRRHVALIVWADAPDAMLRTGLLESSASELAAALGGGPVLMIPVGERVLWAWTSGDAVIDDPDAVSVQAAPGLRAAVGSRAEGLRGMAESHEDARATRHASELLDLRPRSVLGYRSSALTALLTAAPARAVRFVETELGELAGDGDSARRLRATLRIYLEENLSPARAARRLAIHHNTVTYRITKAEEILGHGVEHRRFELEAALRLADRLPALRTAASRPAG